MSKHKQNRRLFITVTVIVGVALIGLFAINPGEATVRVKDTELLTDATAVETAPINDSPVWSILKMVSALVVVVVCIYLSVALLKKAMGKKLSANKTCNSLEVLETTYLAPRKSLSLVRVAEKSVLLGVTDNNISVLTELDAEETVDLLNVEKTSDTEPTKNFKDMLRSASSRIKELGIGRRLTASAVKSKLL